jgi:hypothetical protein
MKKSGFMKNPTWDLDENPEFMVHETKFLLRVSQFSVPRILILRCAINSMIVGDECATAFLAVWDLSLIRIFSPEFVGLRRAEVR